MVQELVSLFLGAGEPAEQIEKLLDSITDLVQSVRPDGSFAYVNRAWRETLGYPAARMDMMRVFDIIHESSRDKCRDVFQRLLAGETVPPFETVFVKADGSRVELEGNATCSFEAGRPVMIRAVLRDVSERHAMENQLRHAQRLESLAVLASGIAHEFNNALTVILGNIELLNAHVDTASAAGPLLTQLHDAGRRAADLTRQMLAYAGRPPFERQRYDVASVVREMRPLLEAVAAENVAIELDLDAGAAALVDGDPALTRQAVMNLVANASESYDGRAGAIVVRTITMNATAEDLQSPYIAPAPRAGRYVCVEVRDLGSGIPADVLPRIFEPFFTTKFIGRGLGLAAALGVVRAHQGTVHVTSDVGEGTTVRMLLPVA